MLNTTMGLGLGLGSGAILNLGDDNERRLTLSEINTGCETKIHMEKMKLVLYAEK